MENFGFEELSANELLEIHGGGVWRELAKVVLESTIVGELIDAATDAVEGYMAECAKGTYVGIPRGR